MCIKHVCHAASTDGPKLHVQTNVKIKYKSNNAHDDSVQELCAYCFTATRT